MGATFDWSIASPLLSAVVIAGGALIGWGKFKEKVENLEKTLKKNREEDNAKTDERIRDLKESNSKEVTGLASAMRDTEQRLMKSIESITSDCKSQMSATRSETGNLAQRVSSIEGCLHAQRLGCGDGPPKPEDK